MRPHQCYQTVLAVFSKYRPNTCWAYNSVWSRFVASKPRQRLRLLVRKPQSEAVVDCFEFSRFLTRKANKFWDLSCRCARDIFSRLTLMQIRWIFWCICNYYDFTTPINSKCCSICFRLAVAWRGSFWDPHCGVRRVLWGLGFEPTESLYPRLPNNSHYKVLLYLPPFGRDSNVNLWRPNSTRPFRLYGRKWYQSKCRPHIPMRLLYTRYIGHSTTRQIDRPSDRNRPPML